MRTLHRLVYLAIVFGLLATALRAAGEEPFAQAQGDNRGDAPAMVRHGSVPEPGGIGLVALLVVLLALQRQRELKAEV